MEAQMTSDPWWDDICAAVYGAFVALGLWVVLCQ